jgi:Uri superfamily endonuclease
MQTAQLSKLGHGSYILILHLERTKIISVGKPGKCSFPAGYYTYVGSALGPGGLAARLKHHMHSTATPHWHIDYLRRRARLVEIWVSEFDEHLEHLWATMLNQLDETVRRFKGFGCSDCKCPSHLFHFPGRPSFHKFKKFVDSRPGKYGQIRRILL